jgi:hypothetical protein
MVDAGFWIYGHWLVILCSAGVIVGLCLLSAVRTFVWNYWYLVIMAILGIALAGVGREVGLVEESLTTAKADLAIAQKDVAEAKAQLQTAVNVNKANDAIVTDLKKSIVDGADTTNKALAAKDAQIEQITAVCFPATEGKSNAPVGKKPVSKPSSGFDSLRNYEHSILGN